MNISITPWKRYGHDRLYASLDGQKLGYRDNVTGTDHPVDPTDASLLTELIEAHLRDGCTSPVGTAPPAPYSTPVPTMRPVAASPTAQHEPLEELPAAEAAWTDLATHRPGQLARKRAKEDWELRKKQYPVRARLGRLLNVHTDERAWRIGADGEEAVGAQLEKLTRKDPRWRVLHSVPVGQRGSDIDHLVIGPAGVVTINTKHHPGAKVWVGKDTLLVNGQAQPYIRNSRFEAKRTTKLLSAACDFNVPVDALIVMLGVIEIAMKAEPGEKDGNAVHITYRRQSIRWLTNQPPRLSGHQVEAVFEHARRSTTWVSAP